MKEKLINQAYEIAKERYANIGIDTVSYTHLTLPTNREV